MSSSHLCEATGCTKATRPNELMCLEHWQMVPHKLQRTIWGHWVRKAMNLHAEAKQEAIDFVERAERQQRLML